MRADRVAPEKRPFTACRTHKMNAKHEQVLTMFPSELTSRQQWLVWRFEKKDGDKKPRKVPYYVNGSRRFGKQGDAEDRAKLAAYDDAKAAAEYGFDGLGFAFLPGDGLIGIDIDSNADTELAHKIIAGCNSYAETSPSGNGWHIFVKGETKTFKSNDVGIEVFCGSQFFTMTGNKLDDAPCDIISISDKLLNRLRDIVKPPNRPLASPASIPTGPTGTAKIESALAYISPDVGYHEWIKIGMAIYSELGPSGFSVWDYWSSRGSAYSHKAMAGHWQSFAGTSVTIATVFRMAIDNGWNPPRDTTYKPRQDAPQAATKSAPASIDMASPLVDVTDQGKPLETIENLADVCRRLGVSITYNVITKSVDIGFPDSCTTVDNEHNVNLAHLKSWCKRFRMATDALQEYVLALADRNTINPVADWINSKPWDGQCRLNDFYETVTEIKPSRLADGRRLRDVLIFRWMMSAVALAMTDTPLAAQGVLTFTGKGNVGKTEWFKNLVPQEMRHLTKEGLTLNPADKDSVATCIGHWLVELGELDGSFRKSDMAHLKAFITRTMDDFRRPYARTDSRYPRRTVMFASVNSREYLQDPTGNRRFWTVEVQSINARHGMDMQQVWAEVAEMWRNDPAGLFLRQEEMDALNAHNEDFLSLMPVHDRIDDSYEWDMPRERWDNMMSATQISEFAGIERPGQREVNEAAAYVQTRYNVEVKKFGKQRLKRWAMPPLTMEAEQRSAKR